MHAREQVALGMAAVKTGEVQYDQRLFNQDAGLGTGFGADDEYGVYDKALFADRRCASVAPFVRRPSCPCETMVHHACCRAASDKGLC
eukprot:scaffold45922_cov22-Tisochrysis_lutea.AAC.2